MSKINWYMIEFERIGEIVDPVTALGVGRYGARQGEMILLVASSSPMFNLIMDSPMFQQVIETGGYCLGEIEHDDDPG